MKRGVYSSLKAAAVLGVLGLGLNGCVAAMFGAAITTANAARQEIPVDEQINDLAIKSDLNARLIQEDGKLFRNIDTTVIEGRVYLKGKVDDYDSRLRATRIAWITPGVREVYNDILVGEGESIGNIASDTWITTKVRAALIDRAAIKDVNYTIETQDGVVYLMGVAQDETERALAVDTARNVTDVKNVVDYLVLKDDPRRGVAQAAPAEYRDVEPAAPPASSPNYAPGYSPPAPVEVRPAGS